MVACNGLNAKIRKLEDLHCLRGELRLRKELLAGFIEARVREELIDECPHADGELIDDLIHAGLSAGNVAAIALAPLAVMAWASGDVTDQEERETLLAIFDSPVSGNLEAVQKFRSWLRQRPPGDLMDLWERYVKAIWSNSDEAFGEEGRDDWCRLPSGQSLYRQAYRIALASGGFLGMMKVCEREQEILNRIEEVYSSKG